MKYLLIFYGILFSYSGWGQMSDSFDDGDFTNNPTWSGDVEDFIVNSDLQLQLNATDGGESYLSTPHNLSQLENQEWRMKIRYNFAPSGNNYGLTYLAATNADLSSQPDGIFFRIGENLSNDPIELIERIGGIETTILTSTPGIVANPFDIGVKIVYRNTGEWELYTDLNGGTNYQLDVSANYQTSIVGTYLGIWLKYTSSNSTRFIYDDFYAGDVVIDDVPPEIASVLALSSTQLRITFSEPIQQNSGETPSNYSVDNGIGNPESSVQNPTDHTQVKLSFTNSFVDGYTYMLTVQNVEDLSGNAMETESISFHFTDSGMSDSFEDGDFADNPTWTGIETDFIVNADKQLQLNATDGGESYLSTPHNMMQLEDREWRVMIRYDFEPSSNNRGDTYLTASDANLSANPDGIFLHIGQNGSDDPVELVIREGGVETTLLTSAPGIVASPFTIGVKVIYRASGVWEMYIDQSGGDNYQLNYTTNHPVDLVGSYLGVYTKYTTSNKSNFYFDDFYAGIIQLDSIPPALVSIQTITSTELLLQFNEGMEQASVEIPTKYMVNDDIGNPLSAVQNESNLSQVILTFSDSFEIGETHALTVEDVKDYSGNTMDSQTMEFMYVESQEPEVGDVIINEFITKTNPSQGLPDMQFVELYNRSGKYFNLEGWKLADNNSSGTIQEGWLMPFGYIILIPSNGALYYPTATLVSSWASLNQTSDEIHLISDNGMVLDNIFYTNDWFKDDEKKNAGGWSIERINPEAVCSGEDNWRASVASIGGTPGSQNSVYDTTPDTQAPQLINAFVTAPNEVTFSFSEQLDSLNATLATLTVTPSLTEIDRVVESAYPKEITISFSELLVEGEVYSFALEGITDCAGNEGQYTGYFVLPQQAEKGDIIINEILFNPLTGGSDFVEVYNNSQKYVNMNGWQLANWKEGGVDSKKKIETDYVLAPDDYVVITKDSSFQLQNYPFAIPGKFIQLSTLPSYNNDSSTVFLLYNDSMMDKVSYHESWHFSLLKSKKGVSLERFDADAPSNSSSNWHSASEPVGFATPGRKNSQDIQPGQDGGTLTLSSKTISPDGDGFEDVLLISYEMSSPDLMGNLYVYDDKGRKVKTLLKDYFIGAQGTIKWEGTREDGTKASIGPHILYLEIFDVNSSKTQYIRKVVTVAGRI